LLLNANHLHQILEEQLSQFGIATDALTDYHNSYEAHVKSLIIGVMLNAEEKLDLKEGYLQVPVAT